MLSEKRKPRILCGHLGSQTDYMVEAAECGTNHSRPQATYLDSIEFFQKCHWKNPDNYSDLYLKKGLSAAQIGERLNIPKQTVLNQLKREGIRLGTNKGRLANPENYRLAYAPYGFAKKDGKLIPNKSELKICRLVVQLRNDSKMSFHEIARELERRRIKGRSDSVSWTHATVGRIYKRWNQKI
jgi:IS30 family transposase